MRLQKEKTRSVRKTSRGQFLWFAETNIVDEWISKNVDGGHVSI